MTTTCRAANGKMKKDIFRSANVTQPVNEISIDGNPTGPESRLMLI